MLEVLQILEAEINLREETRVRDDVTIWRRLLESPYDDVRLQLIADLEQRATRSEQALSERVALDPELVSTGRL